MSLLSGLSSFIDDQKQRLTNVVQVEQAVGENIVNTLTLGKVGTQTNISSTNSIAGAIANNPLTTASLIVPFTGALPGAPAAAQAGSSAIRASLGQIVSKATTGQKIIGGIAVVAGAGLVRSNPEGATVAALNAPSNLGDYTEQIGKVIQHPTIEGVKDVVESHPLLSAATVALGVTTIAGGVSTAVNALNTSAVRANTKATEASIGSTSSAVVQPMALAAPLSQSVGNTIPSGAPPAAPSVSPLVAAGPISTKKSTKKKKKKGGKKKKKKSTHKKKKKVYKKKKSKKRK